MYIIREIFHLQFGRFRKAKALIDEDMQKHLITAIWYPAMKPILKKTGRYRVEGMV